MSQGNRKDLIEGAAGDGKFGAKAQDFEAALALYGCVAKVLAHGVIIPATASAVTLPLLARHHPQPGETDAPKTKTSY
jgi:hypothetical protein